MRFLAPADCESQRPQIEAREVAVRWARLPDAELLDRLCMLGAVERRLVIDVLREHGIQIGGGAAVIDRSDVDVQQRARRDERVPHDAAQFAHWMTLTAFEDARRRTR